MKKILNRKKSNNSHLIYHTLIAVVACILMVVIIQWDRGLFKVEFREGDIALSSIYAPYDFNIRGEINTLATDAAKRKAIEALLPIYVFDTSVQQSVLNKATSVMDSVMPLKEGSDITEEERRLKITALSADFNIPEALIISILSLKDHKAFYESVKGAIERFMSKGIIAVSDRAKLLEANREKIKLIEEAENTESETLTKEFLTLEDLKKEVEDFFSTIRNKKERAAAVDFVNAILSINITYDKEKTQAKKEAAVRKIEPIYNIIEVKKNETILNKGERIRKDHIVKLKGIEQNESLAMKVGGLFGIVILAGLFMLIVVLYIRFYESALILGN